MINPTGPESTGNSQTGNSQTGKQGDTNLDTEDVQVWWKLYGGENFALGLERNNLMLTKFLTELVLAGVAAETVESFLRTEFCEKDYTPLAYVLSDSHTTVPENVIVWLACSPHVPATVRFGLLGHRNLGSTQMGECYLKMRDIELAEKDGIYFYGYGPALAQIIEKTNTPVWMLEDVVTRCGAETLREFAVNPHTSAKLLSAVLSRLQSFAQEERAGRWGRRRSGRRVPPGFCHSWAVQETLNGLAGNANSPAHVLEAVSLWGSLRAEMYRRFGKKPQMFTERCRRILANPNSSVSAKTRAERFLGPDTTTSLPTHSC